LLWIRIRIEFGWLDPDPGGENASHKSEEMYRFKVLDVFF
jgi:hypothetical protein